MVLKGFLLLLVGLVCILAPVVVIVVLQSDFEAEEKQYFTVDDLAIMDAIAEGDDAE